MAERGEVLVLPAVVDPAAVTGLHRSWASRAAGLAAIDFAAVREIDSSGVALVRALAAGARAAGAPPPRLVSVPERFVTLCRAHRVVLEGLGDASPHP